MSDALPTTHASYEKGKEKGERGAALLDDFYGHVRNRTLKAIVGRDENMRHGDKRHPEGWTIEVKSQNIRPRGPDAYPKNIVEVLKQSFDERKTYLADGQALTASYLGITPEQLAGTKLTRKDRSVGTVGHLPLVEASLMGIMGSRMTVYASPDVGFWLAFYDSAELVRLVREAVAQDGLALEPGDCEKGAHAVWIPYPRCVWQKTPGGWINWGPYWLPTDAEAAA